MQLKLREGEIERVFIVKGVLPIGFSSMANLNIVKFFLIKLKGRMKDTTD